MTGVAMRAPPMPLLSDSTRGYLLGPVAISLFGLTQPVTRIAVAKLDPVFVGLGRSVVAAVVAVAILAVRRARRPTIAEWRRLAATAAGELFAGERPSRWSANSNDG